MPDRDPRPERPGPKPAEEPQQIRDRDMRTGRAAAVQRMANKQSWVDEQIRVAMDRGEFDDLPGAGKPLDLSDEHDPDWWLKKLVERERVSVLPPSLQLRKDDAELDAKLDDIGFEAEVRREVEEFNERVIKARYSLQSGPPLITMPRDLDATVAAWRRRRDARRIQRKAELAEQSAGRRPTRDEGRRPRRHWWSRRRAEATESTER